MVRVSLLEWLRTGLFGPLHLGMTRLEVRDLLGPAEDWSSARNPDGSSAIWKYGDFEFYFDGHDAPLHLLRADSFRVPSGGQTMALDPWILRRGLSRRALARRLTAEGIPHGWRRWPYDNNLLLLDVRPVLTLTFIRRRGASSPPSGLHAFSASSRRSEG